MTVKNIVLKINAKKSTLDTLNIEGGEFGRGSQGKPLKIAAKANVHYEFTDKETSFGPENIATKRHDKDLWISFEGGDVDQPDLIIENYYAANGELGYSEGESNLLIGQHENGKYYPYVPESAEKSDAVSLLADQVEAGQALGGEEVAALWAFNPLWLLALVPIAAVAIGQGHDNNKKSPVIEHPQHVPIAEKDSAETKENTPVIIDVTANDTDKDGDLDPSTVVISKQPQHGTVSVDPITGEVTYTPNKGYVGPDQFEYTVKDKAGNVSDPATVVIDITANPVAVDDSANTKEDTPIIIDVTANDTDKDGDLDPSTVVITKQPQNGTVSVDPVTGEVTYTPNKGYVGPDQFEYTVKDKAGNVSDPATVVVEVSANPIAVDDSAETKENTPIIIDVTANDTDKDGDLDPSTVVISKQPQHGTVSVDPITGEVTYTPNKGYVGPDAFEYTVKDKAGNVSDPATVVIDITTNPIAVDDSAETKEDTPIIIDVTANDSDKDGDLDPSTVVITKQPQHGTVSVDPITGEVTYTPNKGYVGPDVFEYTVKDKAGNVSDPATVVIDITANPVAVDDSANTKEDTPIIIDVTANDTDKDGDLEPSTVVISKQPQNGTVSVDPITGEVTYTPNKGYVGPDVFEYTVKDKAGNVSDPATVVIDITANPVAVDDSANTKEDTPIIIDVTSNDTDKDGDLDPSTVVITKQPQNGTVSVDPITGEVTYTPNKGYVGPDQFEYTVKDKAGNVSDPATVVIDIIANPVAVDDSANTKEDTPIIIDVTANDTDKDGDLDPSTVVITKQPQNGTVSVDPITGEVTYTPNKGYVGSDAFEYTVKDKAGNVSDPATVVVEVSANPVAVDDSANTKEDTPIIIDVTANDTDKDGDLDPSTVVITKQPQHGTVNVDPITGEVTYTPNKGYVGPDAFEYTVKDKAGNVSDPATVVIDITANPVAVDDSANTKEDTPIIIDVTSNDTDKDGDLDPSTVVITKQPQNGTVSVDPITGEVTYTPNKGYVGPDQFEYTVKDKAGNVSDPATVVIDITANPVAVDDSAETKEDTPIIIDVTANDTDKDGDLDPSTVVITKQPQNGTVSVDPITGEVTYTPNKGYVGPDVFEYTVKDKAGNVSDPATVVVEVSANPVAVDDSAETKEDTPIIIDVTSNDTDKDGDLDPSTVVITKQPQNGTVSVDPITGEVTYTPNKGYVGPDAFEYTVKDKAGNVSDPATVVIDITANPVALDDSANTKEDTPIIIDVTSNDTDKDGDLDPSTVVITKQPQHGTVSIDPITGEVTYTPNKGYVGPDAFEYTVKDKAGNVSDPATVVVEVSANPVAVDDSANTKENTPIIIDVTSNDTDKDGDLDPSTVVITKQPQNGTVSVDPITGEVTYTPNKGYVGPDAFEYTVKDKAGNVSDPATVVIDITANPVAVDDSAETKENTPIIIDVTSNDTDKDGDLDPSTVVITKQPQNGTVSVDPITGEVTYTPNKGYVGPDAFEYTVKDKAGNVSDPAMVVIDITANPVAVDDSAETKENTPIIIDVTSNDTDKDGDLDPSTVVITKQPQNGTVSVDPITGEVTYTPNKGYVGPDAFEYTVKDKAGNVSDPATVVIEVSANPVAVDDSANTKEDTPIIIDVTANDTDKDGDLDPSTVVISKQPQHGMVSVDPITGEVTYTPNKGYVGPDAFEYTVKDKAGNVSDPATVVIDITANPVAVDDSANTKEDTPIIIDVTANDTDKDGDLDPSTVVITKQPQHGTVSVDPITGEVTYTPNKGYVGPDAFEYTVKDKAGNVSDPATVVIDITANPVAVDDSAETKENTPIIIDVTANDTDKDGDLDPSTVVITKQPQHGTVSVDPITGEVTYTPNKGYVGPDAFEYTVKDKAGNVSDPAHVTLDISPTGTLTEILKEADLGDGSTAAVVNGELSLDNPSNADISDILMTLPTVDVTSGGETINWTQTANGGLVGTTPSGQEVMSITLGTPVTSNGKTTIPYEIGLKAPVDHVGENSERLDLDFGINTNIGDANLIITVEDDKSVAAPISVVADGETTFYANVIISLDLSSSMGARDSGIPDPVNGGEKMRMNAAVEAIETMLDKYQEQLDSVAPGNGDVKVNIIGFSKLAKHLSLPGQTDTWVSLDDAKKIVKGLYNFGTRPKDIGVDTNYDAALQEVIHSYLNNQGAGPVVGVDGAKVNNSLLFVSDGIPNFGNGTDGVRGIQPTSPSNYEPGNQNIDIGEDKWTAFLKEQNIKSIAIGIGPQMDEGADFLKPIAFDGEKGTNKDGSSDIIILKDMSDLGGIMSELVPEATDTQGSIRTDDVGNIVSSFGADGAGQLIIQIDGYDYTYDYATNQITSSNSNASIWQDAGNGVLMVKTEIGGSFKLNMSADKFGDFSYNPAPTRPVGKTQEEFTFTLVDKDGDKSSDKLLIDIQLIPEASASKTALSMSNQLDHLEVFNAVGHTLDGFANTPNPAEAVNTHHINVSQHLEQLSVEQPNLI